MASSIPIELELFLNRTIWPIDGTLRDITTPSQSEPWSNGNEKILHTPPELQFSVKLRTVLACVKAMISNADFSKQTGALTSKTGATQSLSSLVRFCMLSKYLSLLK